MRIIKYPLAQDVINAHQVPNDFTPLTVALQYGVATIWGETNYQNPRDIFICRPMYFFVVGTGWDVKHDGVKSHYIGTTIDPDGLVWHHYWSWAREAIEYGAGLK